MTEPQPTTSDALALLGMVLIAAGVLVWLGVGPALVASGAMMLATAIVLAVSRARAGRT